MANLKLTKRAVDGAEPIASGDTFIWDTDLRGFGLRITPRGVKSYVIQYRMKGRAARRMTLGGHGSPWTPDAARKEAERRLIQVKQGIDPVEEVRRIVHDEQTLGFDAYADQFIELYLKSNWHDTWNMGKGVLNSVKPHFGNKSIRLIKRSDVADLLDKYADRPGARKLTHSVLRKLFNWATDRGDIEQSPIANMKAPKAPAARRRVLSHEELICVWLASAGMGKIWQPLIRLLIVTLQRREEIASLDWSEINLVDGMWELPAERAKNDVSHRVPLCELALLELRALDAAARGFVFTSTGTTSVSGYSKAKAKLDRLMFEMMKMRAVKRGENPDEVEFVPWRIHDLRRTGTTNLQALGVPIEVTEAVLNHVSGTTSGVAGIYNRFKYDPQKRLALEAWSKQLSGLIQGTGSTINLTPFVSYGS